ncbi:MAG: DGQHR domain-containing protein, partial [Candidatus Competibacteraceae bacterium]
ATPAWGIVHCVPDTHARVSLNSRPVRQHKTRAGAHHCSRTGRYSVSKTIVIAASKVRQGELVLFTTSVKVSDLVSEGFYSVETLDPENMNDKGYQRLLNKARAKKLADYIVKGQDSQDAFLPTSVFLATDKSIDFDSSTNTIAIDIGKVGPFSVVDGQHRLEGLKMAAEKDSRVLGFEVPVNIAINLPKIAQMCHFLIVNTTQKSVDKSVEQRIIARLSDALDIEDDLPSLPKWIFNTVERGEVEKAVKYADYLNDSTDSPWHGKIKMANSTSDEGSMNQRSFVKAIVKYVLTANNPLSTIVKDFEKEKKIFLNYWKAIAAILDDGNAAVLYKYNGVELFCKFSIPFFIKLQDRGSFTAATMEALLRSCFDNVEGEYAGVGHPDWWAKGGKSSFLNAGAINVVSQEMAKALHKSSAGGAIEL